MNKVKLIIFPGNFLPHIGGLETHVDEFVKYLSKDPKYEITIFSPNVVGAIEKETIHNNVKVIRYPAFEAVYNYPFPKFWSIKFWKLFFGLYKNRYNIVMTRTRFFSNSTLGMIFAKFRIKRCKLVHVEHGSEFVKLSSKFKSFIAYIYDMTFGKLLFKLADKNIAISAISKKFVCKEFKLKRNAISIFRRGIDINHIDKYKKNFKLEKQFQDKVVLCYIGRLYAWKGVDNAIKAYNKLPKSLRDKSVFIIGGYGEDLKRLEKIAKKDLNSKIFFLGKINLGDNYSIMKSSDIYIHSSYPGGALSSSLLQAMYCECAIVASPNEGANEVVLDKNNGILLKNNSVDNIKQGMQSLISDSRLRSKYSKEAKKYIVENFDWEKVIFKYEKMFEEVLN